MIYNQNNYQEEKDLVLSRIARIALKRQYPAKYLEEINNFTTQFYNLFNYEPNSELLSHPKVLEAFQCAEQAHLSQERKYTYQPYIVHLYETASLVSSLDNSTHDEVIAAILHDVVEKGGISLDYIKENFGDIVHQHVTHLTDIATLEDGNREVRIKKNWEHFSQGLAKTKNIKAIDILSNTRSTMLCDARYGKTYLEPIVNIMNPYFQNSQETHPIIKELFNNMTNLGVQIIESQNKYGIHKIEKDLAKQEKAQRNKAKAQGMSI